MDEQQQETKGTGRVLRQKIVNLLYLIFIVLAFLHIPSGFVDLFSDVNRSFEIAENRYNDSDSYDLYHYDLQIFDYLITKNPEKGKLLYDKFSIINKSSTVLIEILEQFKQDLIAEAGGINEFGYPLHAKNYNHTENILLIENQADSLLSGLKEHRELIYNLAGISIMPAVDSLLPSSDNISLSTGKMVKWSEYYFKKNPVAGATAILSMFQLGLKKADQLVLESYIIDLNEQGGDINMGISSGNSRDLKAVLRYKDRIDTLNVDDKNQVRFIPENLGKYQISVFNDFKTMDVDFNIISPFPSITAGQYPIMYTGIDNQLVINHKEIPFENLSVNCTNGEIIKQNKAYYFRKESTGITEITVFGKRNQKNILLVKQTFEIKTLPDLQAYIMDEKATNIAVKTGFKPVSFLKSQTRLLISSKTEKTLSFPVKNFNLKRITTDNKITSRTNRGGDFRERTIQLINEAKPGDIYIFDNIIGEDVFGSEFNVPSVVYYIK